MRSSAAITGSRSGATASILDQYCSSGGLGGGGAEGILEALSHAPLEAPKPRILVCAPSNAATDELLDRILTDGFCDFGGAMYRYGSGRAVESEQREMGSRVWNCVCV